MEDDDITRKIAALLAKAEGTDNENESAAFFGKATELMLKYSIDEARARAAAGSSRTAERIVRGDLDFDWFYAPAKEQLIAQIGRSQNVRVVLVHHEVSRSDRTLRRAALVGYARDIENVRMLYASLVIQAIRDGMTARRSYHGDAGKVKFMTSFLHGFAAEVGIRLNAQIDAARQADPTGMALVDMRRSEVDDAIGDHFPSLVRGRARSVGTSGYGAGVMSGRSADIGNPGVASSSSLKIGSGR